MEVFTDLPGMQFYIGNFIEQEQGKDGCVYGKRGGFCMETQYYPDACNQAAFQSSVLKAGEKYDTTTIYKIFCEKITDKIGYDMRKQSKEPHVIAF